MFFRQRFARQVGAAFSSTWSNTPYMRILCTSRSRLSAGTTLSRSPLARYAHIIVCLFFFNQCVHGPLLNLKSRIWLSRVILWYFDADFANAFTCPKNICIPCHRLLWIFLLWNEKIKSWIIMLYEPNLYNTHCVISYYVVTVNCIFHIKSPFKFNKYSCLSNTTPRLFYFTIIGK